MRLALKLLSSLAGTVLIVLACELVADSRRHDELAQMNLEIEWRTGRALRVVLMAVAKDAGPAAARRLVENVDANLPRSFKWRSLDTLPPIEGRDLGREVAAHIDDGEPVFAHRNDEAGEELRYMYIPLALPGGPPAVVEVSESMEPLHAFMRKSQYQTAAVGFAVLMMSAGLAAVLGRRMIADPVHTIAKAVRALGEDAVVEVPPLRRGDELGELASEVSSLGARLSERRRLEHEDRLRTIGQLASGVAHELGTPLSVIGVRARMIATGEATGAEASATATAIVEQSERMTRLIRQLLDYARRDAGAPGVIDVSEAARRAIEMLQPLARKQGVTIGLEGADRPLSVAIDRGQLEQVITNLVLNGIQAMGRGGSIEVALGSGRAMPRGGRGRARAEYVLLSVTDDGEGIPPERLPHVFEPFFTTKSVGEGTGLGLSIAQAIVEEHGGWIEVTSEPGKGARFTVYLPPAREQGLERLAS